MPSLKHNILSVKLLCNHGLTVSFNDKYAHVMHPYSDMPIIKARLFNDLYVVDMLNQKCRLIDKHQLQHFVFATEAFPNAEPSPVSGGAGGADVPSATAIPTADPAVPVEPVTYDSVNNSGNVPFSVLWHKRLGHISKSALHATHSTVAGLPELGELNKIYDIPCGECLDGRFPAASHSDLNDKPSGPCDLLYADLMGLFSKGFDGSLYTLSVIDAFSGYAIVTPIKSKDVVLSALKQSIDRFQQLSHKSVTELRTDYGTEFHNESVISYLSDNKIKLSHSAPYIHQQVGLVERFHRSVMEICRSLLSESKRATMFWPAAITHAAYLYNRRCSVSRKQGLTKYELLTGEKPDLSKLRIWGCGVYVKVENQINKLEPRADRGVFLGFDEYSDGFKVMVQRSVYIRSNVVFDECMKGLVEHKPDFSIEQPVTVPAASVSGASACKSSDVPVAQKKKRERKVYEPTSGALCVRNKRHATANVVQQLQSDRDKFTGTYIPFLELPEIIPGQPLPIPETYEEAMSCKYAVFWAEAMKAEYESLSDMGVYEVQDLPCGKNALSSKWVFTWKVNNGKVVKAKARLVVRGFEQREGEDYFELFAPTVAQTTIRSLLSLAASNNLYIRQIDFATAFLNGDLEEEVFLKLPAGFTGALEHQVWKLNKSLYGLKQAPRCWHLKLRSNLSTLGYKQSDDDQALFYRRELDGHLSFLIVHVDDMMIMHPSKDVVMKIVSQIEQIFKITDCGRSHEYLGILVEHLTVGIFIHQTPYCQGVLKKFLSHDKLHASTPMKPDTVLINQRELMKDDEKPEECVLFGDPKLYASCVGSIMYLSNISRPDIAHTVNQLCRFISKPTVAHWHAAQHLLAYLNHTHDHGILYERGRYTGVHGFCDASFSCDKDNGRSITGYCFLLSGSIVAWQSKQQPTVALSTAEAEYMAITESGKHGIHMKFLLDSLEVKTDWVPLVVSELDPAVSIKAKPKVLKKEKNIEKLDAIALKRAGLMVYSDSMSALAMVMADKATRSMRHVDCKHHWAREKYEERLLNFTHVAGVLNVADAFTKFLPKDVFLRHRDSMGMKPWRSLEHLVVPDA